MNQENPTPTPPDDDDRQALIAAMIADDNVPYMGPAELGPIADAILADLKRRGRLVERFVPPTGSMGTTVQPSGTQVWNSPAPAADGVTAMAACEIPLPDDVVASFAASLNELRQEWRYEPDCRERAAKRALQTVIWSCPEAITAALAARRSQ